MVAPVPRRDPVLAAKDSGAPPKLSQQSINGTPPQPPARRTKSAVKRLNQLEKTCYIGVNAGAESPAPDSTPESSQRSSERADSVWMGSGYMKTGPLTKAQKPKIGDGSGDGVEERSPIMPWFFNTDSHLLERRRVQSQVQCISRVLRDHNRSPAPKHRQPGATPALVAPPPAPGTTFVVPDPRSPTPPLGKGRPGGMQLLVPPRSNSRLSPPAERSHSRISHDNFESESDSGAPQVYSRHYGTQQDGTPTRNWPNEEYGIFPGSGHSTGALSTYTTKKAREHTSLRTLLRDKSTHARSTIPLPDKYNQPVTSAQEVGWDLRQAEWHDNQQFPRMRCYFTRYDQDLKIGGVQDQLVLRRMGMKC